MGFFGGLAKGVGRAARWTGNQVASGAKKLTNPTTLAAVGVGVATGGVGAAAIAGLGAVAAQYGVPPDVTNAIAQQSGLSPSQRQAALIAYGTSSGGQTYPGSVGAAPGYAGGGVAYGPPQVPQITGQQGHYVTPPSPGMLGLGPNAPLILGALGLGGFLIYEALD